MSWPRRLAIAYLIVFSYTNSECIVLNVYNIKLQIKLFHNCYDFSLLKEENKRKNWTGMHATWVLKLRAIFTRCFESQSFLKSSVPELDFFFQMFFSSFEYFSSFRQTLRPYFSSFGSLVLIHRMILWRKELRKSFPGSRWALNLRPCRHQLNSLTTELLRALVLSRSFVGWHSDHIFQSHMSLWLARISIRF